MEPVTDETLVFSIWLKPTYSDDDSFNEFIDLINMRSVEAEFIHSTLKINLN